MKSLYVLSLLLAVASVSSYDTAHDDFEIKDAIINVNVLKKYNHCFLDTGVCNEIGAFFKPFIPDAVKTACANCTQAQKRLAHKYFEALEAKLPEEYESFKNKYDPKGIYFKIYRDVLDKY